MEHNRDKHIFRDNTGKIHLISSTNELVSTLSVSSLLDRDFPPFDADIVIAKMMESPKWPQSKYFGMTKEQIKAVWEVNTSKHLGTELHHQIEIYLKTKLIPDLPSTEFQHFLTYLEQHPHYELYRCEWPIYYQLNNTINPEKKVIIGIPDCLFRIPSQNNDYILIDWKRTKNLRLENQFENAKGSFSDLPNSDYYRYVAQLSYYAYIMEIEYQIKVSRLQVVVLHPENKRPIVHELPYLRQYVHQSINDK